VNALASGIKVKVAVMAATFVKNFMIVCLVLVMYLGAREAGENLFCDSVVILLLIESYSRMADIKAPP